MKAHPMSCTRTLLVVPLLFVLLGMGPIGNNPSNQDEHEEFWKFVQTVQDILAGKNLVQAQTSIPPGAGLICGARLEHLKDVVAGEVKACSLADTSYHGVMLQAKTNPSEDAGFLVLKTQKSDTAKVRFHTVVFMRDSTGQYKISMWHAGDCSQ